MPIPTTNATEELPAVNQILASVGQAPVTTLDQTNPDVAIAYNTLLQVSREIQAEGWTFNTEIAVPFTPDGTTEEVDVARIMLRNAENTILEKMEDGLFKPEGFEQPGDFEGSEEPVYVTTHGLEGSSAKTYDILTRMIELERSFEIKVNIIKELSDLSQDSNSLMQVT